MLPGFSQEEIEALSSAGREIDQMIAAGSSLPLREFLHYIVSKSGILATAVATGDQMWNLQLLNTLFDFIRDEQEKQKLDLSGFLALIDDMSAQGIALPAEKLCGEGEGVCFTTAHGSKGLEFDHVFMIGCTSKVWDTAPRNRTYALPSTVFKSVIGSEEEEARRLFYVGMTRARKGLCISLSGKDNSDKALERSRFVAELVEAGGCVVAKGEVSAPELVAVGRVVLGERPARASIFDDTFLDSILKNYRLSVSHLSAYLKCPTAFYFTRLLHAPQAGSIARTFGLAVHHALEVVFKAMVANDHREFPEVEVFMSAYREYMRRFECDFGAVEYRRRMAYAEAVLPLFYGGHVAGWCRDSLVEVSLRATVAGVPCGGKLDRIEFLDRNGNIDIVDDKSGNFQYAKKKLAAPDPEKVIALAAKGQVACFEAVYGGDYWRQAVFYQILAEADKDHDFVVGDVSFEFCEPDKASGEFFTVPVPVGEFDQELVKIQISEAYKRIKNHEFDAGCGDPDCEWCQFVARLETATHTNENSNEFQEEELLLAA